MDIQTSYMGRRWLLPDLARQEEARFLGDAVGISPLLASLLVRQGVTSQSYPSFIKPRLRDMLPDPYTILGMEKAAARIFAGIKAREKIVIFGDYDVDGVTSSTLLRDYIRHFGHDAEIYIPDRLLEGYGPSIPAMRDLAKNYSLIVTVDCGSTAFEPIHIARTLGADIVVLDHHMIGETLPDAIIVNPNRADDTSSLGYLCAAGVVFLALVALNRLAKEAELDTPDLIKDLDLVALATVADAAPLIGLNRAFIRSGLLQMEDTKRLGLHALITRFLPARKISVESIGYTLAPRLNATGRIGHASLSVDLLSTRDAEKAQILVHTLEDFNQRRQEIERKITQEAIAQIEESSTRFSNLVVAYQADWHPGVLGIVAARLKERFMRPALVLCQIDGLLHGSGRSVLGMDLGQGIAELVHEGLLTKGGGHKMAAGLTLEPTKLDAAMARLDAVLGGQSDALSQPALEVEGILTPKALSLETLDLITQAGPFGSAAPVPVWAVMDVQIMQRFILGGQHIRYRLQSLGSSFEVMAFGAVGGTLDQIPSTQRFHVALEMRERYWRDERQISLGLVDIAPA